MLTIINYSIKTRIITTIIIKFLFTICINLITISTPHFSPNIFYFLKKFQGFYFSKFAFHSRNFH